MYIHELLEQQVPREIQTMKPEGTLSEAAAILCEQNIGSLLIMNDSGELIGILTERDMVRAVNESIEDLANRRVSEIMTGSVITCRPNDDVLDILNVMNRRGIRHMPVIDGQKPIAVISIREFDFACKRLQALALTDDLTGLSGRRHFSELLDSEFSRYNRFRYPFCVAMLDIDNFKQINDTYGHSTGDQVLRSLARIFNSNLRAYDTVGRLGGDEFGIIFPNTLIENAIQACGHLVNAIRSCEVMTDRRAINFTASFGIASINSEVCDSASILIQADKYMYAAKSAGRDRIVAESFNGTAFRMYDPSGELERAADALTA